MPSEREYPLSVRMKQRYLRLKYRAFHRLRKAGSDQYRLCDFQGGKIYLDIGESPHMLFHLAGVYEYWKTELFKKLVKPGMTVVDVGSSRGVFALMAARLVGDKGRVLAFEPDPENHRWLKRSIEANGYDTVSLFRFALSDEAGETTFFPGRLSGQGSMFDARKGRDRTREPFKVKIRTMDSVMKREGIKKVDVMKIDVQGADIHVLRGAKRTFKRSDELKLLMDMDVEEDEDRKTVLDILTSADMSTYAIGKELRLTLDPADIIHDFLAVKKGVELPQGL